jgi:hypothetical protein
VGQGGERSPFAVTLTASQRRFSSGWCAGPPPNSGR